MKNFEKIHTFVICAYKESPYLEECIKSLVNQKVKSKILVITSTPNDYIQKLAQKYEIPLIINKGQGGIVQDWNFGYSQANTPYITIAHQDDIYFPDYSDRALKALGASKHPLIYFSDYCEVRNGKKVRLNKLLRIKKIMLYPLRVKILQKSRFVRRRILSLGSPICCPAVTFATENLPNPVFTVRFRACEDWEAWERISKIKGEFLYDAQIGMGHRIHEGSETSIIIGDNERTKEDFQMFCKFWPKCIARLLAAFYATSENSNKVN